MKTIIEQIANKVQATKTCNQEWKDLHEQSLYNISKLHLPSGSGIDSGCTIDIENSTINKIIIYTSFHHLNENGCYDGWTNHKVIVKPAFIGSIDMRITGPDRNQIKDYLYEIFDTALLTEIENV